MATIEIDLLQPEYGFEATDQSGNKARYDTAPDHGGHNFGVRPMQSLLMALGSCSGVDIVSILKKKRQNLTGLRMTIHGEREQGKEPAVWIKAHVIYHIAGEVEEDKAHHAVSLSIDKYCSVAETLRRAGCAITWELKVNA